MAMMTTHLLEKVRVFASQILQYQLKDSLKYHNYAHTLDVVEATWEIASNSDISPRQIELLLVAAWFHDTGHRKQALDHEDESQNIAQDFLQNEGLSFQEIACVKGCIRATKMPQNPQNFYEQIICDADLAHLGRANFAEKSELLRQEWELLSGKKIQMVDFALQSLNFLKNHQFFTPYAQRVLGKIEKENIIREEQNYQKMLRAAQTKNTKSA